MEADRRRTRMIMIDIRMMTPYHEIMKRTTLILDDACLKGIKDLARKEDRSLSDVVRVLLAEGLQRRKGKRRREFEIPNFSMGKPRVNLGDRSALEALMDS